MKQWNIRDLTLGGLFTALIGVGAFLKITIPVQPVPMHFTLQFFFVLLAALLLGSKRAFASVLTYLVIGLCGIPVFATGGGPAYLLKPTFGFLIRICRRFYVTDVYMRSGKVHLFPGFYFLHSGDFSQTMAAG